MRGIVTHNGYAAAKEVKQRERAVLAASDGRDSPRGIGCAPLLASGRPSINCLDQLTDVSHMMWFLSEMLEGQLKKSMSIRRQTSEQYKLILNSRREHLEDGE